MTSQKELLDKLIAYRMKLKGYSQKRIADDCITIVTKEFNKRAPVMEDASARKDEGFDSDVKFATSSTKTDDLIAKLDKYARKVCP